MANLISFKFKGRQLKLTSGEYRLFQKTTKPSKYQKEISEKISRDKKRLRDYFTKYELTNKERFMVALKQKFSKLDNRGVDTGRALRERPEMMWKNLKLKEEFIEEQWYYSEKKQKWNMKVKRDPLGRFMKVEKIKMLVQEEEQEVGSRGSAYSEGEESSEKSSYSV